MSMENPQFFSGPPLSLEKQTAKSGHTWLAGTPGRLTDSGAVPLLSNATEIDFLFAQDQASSTSAGDKVWINKIESAETKFVIGLTNGGSDTKATTAMIGAGKGVAIADSVLSISTANDSNKVFYIHGRLADVEGYRNDTSDVPGYVVASVIASTLTA